MAGPLRWSVAFQELWGNFNTKFTWGNLPDNLTSNDAATLGHLQRRRQHGKGGKEEAGQKGRGKGGVWREREKGKEKRRGETQRTVFFKENRIR